MSHFECGTSTRVEAALLPESNDHTADLPNYRQQQALDAIDRAAINFDIAIRAHAPDTDAVRQAQNALVTVAETVKAAIMMNRSVANFHGVHAQAVKPD